MDVEILARIQFAFTVGFHYIFPPLSIGLGLIMVLFEGMYLKTKNKEYEILAKFWTKIFALTFVLGVSTGIVMEFEFGTNWAATHDLWAMCLVVRLQPKVYLHCFRKYIFRNSHFWRNKTKPIMHFISTIGAFIGSMFSAVWISSK